MLAGKEVLGQEGGEQGENVLVLRFLLRQHQPQRLLSVWNVARATEEPNV